MSFPAGKQESLELLTAQHRAVWESTTYALVAFWLIKGKSLPEKKCLPTQIGNKIHTRHWQRYEIVCCIERRESLLQIQMSDPNARLCLEPGFTA